MTHRIVLAAALALASASLSATTYTFEPNYTQGVFRWDHLGFANPTAQFSQGEGKLEYDPADPTRASVKVTLSLANVHTGVPALDDHLRSEDFFDTTRFPNATFTSTRVEKGDAANRLKVTGQLSLHGVTQPVVLDVTVNKIGANPRSDLPSIGFDATTTLKRSSFNLGKYVPQVGDEINVQITVEAAEAKAYARYLKAREEEEAAAAKDAAKK